MHNFRIFIGIIDYGVETIFYVTAAGIIIAYVNGRSRYILGHNFLPKVLVEYRYGRAICRVIRGYTRLSVGRGEKSGVMSPVL